MYGGDEEQHSGGHMKEDDEEEDDQHGVCLRRPSCGLLTCETHSWLGVGRRAPRLMAVFVLVVARVAGLQAVRSRSPESVGSQTFCV